MSKKTNHDRISVLPDPVLFHILSFLDMKQVLKTSVLSKRWQHIWTSVPTLTFKHDDSEENANRFVAWVHKTLLCCRNTSIKKLDVEFLYCRLYASDFDSWARFALDKEVRDLRLYLTSCTPAYTLPRSLYCNKFLINLSIHSCKLVPKLGLSWTCLQSLSMKSVELNDDTFAKILSGSPMLVILKIESCRGFNRLNINSESLRELVIINMFSFNIIEVMLEISAPNLQNLLILADKYTIVKLRMLSVSSFLKAKLDFNFYLKDSVTKTEYKKQYAELIECFHHVPELELGIHCIQALAMLPSEEKPLTSPLSRLSCLKLNAYLDRQDVTTIITLLKWLPNLEKLVLMRQLGSEYLRSSTFWNPENEKFPFPCLKTVMFHGFMRLGDVNEFTLTLVQFLLDNAVPLESLVFCVEGKDYHMLAAPRSA